MKYEYLHPNDNGVSDDLAIAAYGALCLVSGCTNQRLVGNPRPRYCATHMAELSKSYEECLIKCEGCGGTTLLRENRLFQVKDPERFCSKTCEDSLVRNKTYQVRCRVNSNSIAGETISVGSNFQYSCNDISHQGFYWLCQGVASIEHPPDLKLDMRRWFKLIKISEVDSSLWTIEEVGTVSATEHSVESVSGKADSYKASHHKYYPPDVDLDVYGCIKSETVSSTVQEDNMTGTVYTGVVVRSKTVALGEGVTTGVIVSEIVFESPKSFIAANAEMARAKVLVDAKLALMDDLDLESTLVTLEVKLWTPNS